MHELLAALDERIDRLEEVAERWEVPGGPQRLARRARDKAEGIRLARRLLVERMAADADE